jgi:organic hydroperoxide reductase OsmC/OhrA
MHAFPHRYTTVASAEVEGDVRLTAARLPALATATPAEFDGPGDRWSPETLLVAAVGDCFVLTFRGIARASKLPWSSVTCEVEGVLERVERVTQFTRFDIRVKLQVPPGTNVDQARRLVEKAEQTCLITNSLRGETRLETQVEVGPGTAEASAAGPAAANF